jgi:esterase/lipase superfamily enzyme
MHSWWIRRSGRWVLLGLTASALLGACAARTRPTSAMRDTLWYVSARLRDEAGRDVRAVAPTLEYGAAIFERTPVRDPVSDALTFTLRDSLRLTRDAFAAALRTRMAAPRTRDDVTVLYVHGFGTGLDECWTHPMHARYRSLSSAPWVAFCWPSHGAGITWPRRGSVFVRAYENDTTALIASMPAFLQTLHEVTGALGAERVLLATHSLGGRLVSEALAQDMRTGASGAQTTRDTLRALVFIAPDHDAARFADTLVPVLRGTAQRLVLYTARRDRALTISRRMHDAPRAGLADPAPLVRDALETVDATTAFAADGWWQRLVGNRHSIRRAAGMLWDLTHVLGGARAASCRDTLGTGHRTNDGAWHLLPLAHPDTARLAFCPMFAPPTTSPPAP